MAARVDETNEAVSKEAPVSPPGVAGTYSPMNDRRDGEGLSEERLHLRRPRPRRAARSNQEWTQWAGRLRSVGPTTPRSIGTK